MLKNETVNEIAYRGGMKAKIFYVCVEFVSKLSASMEIIRDTVKAYSS
jgi:hypothetical protein